MRGYGALGNGTHNDTPSINRAIAAASRNGGTVDFPPGVYLAGGSIHMLSDVTLHLPAGSTLLGGRDGYDPPEPNPFAIYQDPGHSHFHDAMIWGENLKNAAFIGPGTIDGGGNLLDGEPVSGRADKLLAIARCSHLTISDLTIRRGGHFAIMTNGCTDVRSSHLRILTTGARDGWNVINSSDVRITHLVDHAYDDALVFKSELALGEALPSGDVTVTNSKLSSVCCNALMFGSETCGNFSHYRFSGVDITGAGKSGLGMVSIDGGRISDVDYADISMTGVAGPILEKIGRRLRCPGPPGVGSISGISYRNITASSTGAYSPTLWGEPGHPITGVSFENVHIRVPGGHPATSLALPYDDAHLYNPNTIGPRPAYGFYLHDVAGVTFRDSSFLIDTVAGAGGATDAGAPGVEARPAFVVNDGVEVDFDRVSTQESAGSPFEIILQGRSSARLTASRTTGGSPLAVGTSCGRSEPSIACLTLPPWYADGLATLLGLPESPPAGLSHNGG